MGTARTVPPGFTPASDVGNLSILGYDPRRYYSGRAPLEAAHLGVELGDQDVAFRCNLVTSDGDRLMDYSAGHISSEEARTLIERVGGKLGSEQLRFYPGVQYRHLAVFRDSQWTEDLLKTQCAPPHDILGELISQHRPEGPAADRLMNLMQASREVLTHHEINQVRIDLNENPGNMIWLWGQGKKMKLPTFQERWKITGSVISAVDVVRGAGRLAGLEVLQVPGEAGDSNSNLRGKAEAALEALRSQDFAFVHVEAADEAGHEGQLRQKISAIEQFDREVVGPILKKISSLGTYRVLIIPDHPTPVLKRCHTADPVPFGICGHNVTADSSIRFGESQAKQSGWFVEEAHDLLPQLLSEKNI